MLERHPDGIGGGRCVQKNTLRLVVASAERAKEMGIDWWETGPALSSRARRDELARENAELRALVAELSEPERGRPREEPS